MKTTRKTEETKLEDQQRLPTLREAYDMYSKDVFSISYHFLSNIQEAEDVVQDVFIKYSEKITELHNTNIFAWVKRVTVNKCFDRSRKFTRILKYAQAYLLENDDGRCDMVPEQKNELVTLLAKIDEKSRMVLILKFMHEMDYEEISVMLNTPIGTLKSLVSRALKKINDERNHFAKESL